MFTFLWLCLILDKNYQQSVGYKYIMEDSPNNAKVTNLMTISFINNIVFFLL